ncbi:MAG: hypothetical protein ACFNXZ_12720, partial [Lautropia mirabilis]
RTPYTTVPIGIIHKRDVTITVCYYETNMMIDFVSYQQKRGVGFTDYVDMIFRLFLSSAVWYLKWKRPPGLPGAAVAMKFDFDGSEMAA